MTDIQVNTQIQSEFRAFDEKVNKLENALESLNQTLETQAQSPGQPLEESRQESPILSATKRSHYYDTVKVTQELDQLHHKVDDILLKNHHAPVVSVSTHHITDIIHDPIYAPSIHSSPRETQKLDLAKSTYISEHLRQYPRYDRNKLDEIVGRILNVRYAPSRVYESSPYSHLLDSKFSNLRAYDSNLLHHSYLETRYAPTRIYVKNPYQSSTYYNIQLQESAGSSYTQASNIFKTAQKTEKVAKKVPTHHVGIAENDVDSLIFDHIKEVQEEVVQNNQQYNNFYVGSMNEDLDDIPRTKRIGKRQEVSQARKQNDSGEFVEKSVYDQKKNQKTNTEQAKKALNAGESVHEDFDFSKNQANRKA